MQLNRFGQGKGGKTSFERRGPRASSSGRWLVLRKRKSVGGAMGKFTLLWEDGIYVGVHGSPGGSSLQDLLAYGGRGMCT